MSELKSMLLHLDASANSAVRLELGRRLAQAHAAQLDVLYAVLPALLQYPFAFTGDAQAVTLLMKYEAAQRELAKAAFEHERSRGDQSCAVTWSETSDEPVHAFIHQAWASDLLLLAQHDPTPKAYSGVPPDFTTAVLLGSGKPGLVMPYIGGGATLGDNVLVAWKPTAESARAVTAALPILQRARQVHVAFWDEAGGTPSPLAIEAYLHRHGIAATLHRAGRPTRDLGELLLSKAADLQADLLVMGCYGHGRAREWVLGGVTRTVLNSMTLPVLFAH